MLWGAYAAGPRRSLVGCVLQPRDQLLEVVRWHRLLGDDKEWAGCEQHDRLEILHHIVLKGHDCGIDDVGRKTADPDGVAITRRAGDATGTYAARGSRHILNDERL